MKVSEEGLAEIAGHEGIVLSPYYDSVGVLTFGIGHTANAGPPDPKTLPMGKQQPVEYAMEVFARDIAKFEKRVNDAVKVPLKQHEFDALVSFDFNTGGIHRATLTKLINAGDRAGAAKAFMGWKRPPEIIPRRRAEMKLFRTGKYAGDGMATIYPANAAGKVQWDSGKRVNVLELIAPSRPKVTPTEPFHVPPDYVPPEPKPAPTGFWSRLRAFFGF